MNEHNFYISYFCRSLEGELSKYEKRYYELPQTSRKGYKRCKDCGGLIENDAKNRKYCSKCRDIRRLETKRNWWKNNH